MQSRYYDSTIGRFINADSIEYLAPESLNGLNLYAYCLNNPVMMTDSTGRSPEWGTFWRGVGRVVTGIVAVVAGALVIASGVALIPMLIVAGVTIAAGALTVVNGAADIGQGISGYNFMRDGVFGGNQTAYNWYSGITEGVAIVGSMICGGWLKVNQPRIRAYKNVGNSTMAKGTYARNASNRPYMDSMLTKQQIIKYGKMTKDATGVYNFAITGSTQIYIQTIQRATSHSGTWKLTYDIINNIIYHLQLL